MPRTLTKAEWYAEGERRFGPDHMQWAFVCPVCKHVQTVADYKAAKAPEGYIAFSCVGRMSPTARAAFGGDGPGPCNYAGGGLFALNPLTVTEDGKTIGRFFDFAEAPVVTNNPAQMSAAALAAGATEEAKTW